MLYTIKNKIYKNEIPDSEIIQDIESAKKIPEFDINSRDASNWSLLMHAIIRNREELVRYILSVPYININHRSNYDNTVLYACNYQISILKLLLNHRDIDVNTQNDGGNTGLHNFCRFGPAYKICVKELLLDARINTSICDIWGDTAQDIALIRGYSGIAKIIGNSRHTSLLRIPNNLMYRDIVRMIIEEYL